MIENKIDDYSKISGSCGDGFIDGKIERKEILGFNKKLKITRLGSGGLVVEFLKYGGMDIIIVYLFGDLA